jgi:hypothetical protein
MHWYSKNRFIPIYKTSPFYRQQKEWKEKRHKKQGKDQIPNPSKENPERKSNNKIIRGSSNISKRVWFVHHYTSIFVSLPHPKRTGVILEAKGGKKDQQSFFPLLYQPP